MSQNINYSSDWQNFWIDYITDGRRKQNVESLLDRYPRERGLTISYSDVLNVGYDQSTLQSEPDMILRDATKSFKQFVDSEYPSTKREKFKNLKIHISGSVGLKSATRGGVKDNVNSLVRIGGELIDVEDPELYLFDAAFECPDGHITEIEQPLKERRGINTCGESSCQNGAYFVPRKSRYLPRQRAVIKDDEFGENECWIEAGDMLRIQNQNTQDVSGCGISRAEFADSSTSFDTHIEVCYLASQDPAAGWN